MPRYIDAELLKEKIFPIGMVADGNYGINAKAIKVAIDNQPTADVVEVVRCKDCCWCIVTSPPYAAAYCIKGMRSIIVEPDDFCSYGERKEG
jgi:hypothetical protein